MKIVFKKRILDILSDLLTSEVYTKNLPDSKIDHIALTKDEAIRVFDETHGSAGYKGIRWEPCGIEKLHAVNNSRLFGFPVKVEDICE